MKRLTRNAATIKPKRRVLGIKALVMVTGVCLALFIVIPGFVRARYYRSSNACLNTLRQIDGATQQWFLENRNRTNYVPTQADLLEYIVRDTNWPFPKCPAGGAYIIGGENKLPRCTAGRATWPNSHILDGADCSWWDNFTSAYGVLFGLRPEPDSGRQ